MEKFQAERRFGYYIAGLLLGKRKSGSTVTGGRGGGLF